MARLINLKMPIRVSSAAAGGTYSYTVVPTLFKFNQGLGLPLEILGQGNPISGILTTGVGNVSPTDILDIQLDINVPVVDVVHGMQTTDFSFISGTPSSVPRLELPGTFPAIGIRNFRTSNNEWDGLTEIKTFNGIEAKYIEPNITIGTFATGDIFVNNFAYGRIVSGVPILFSVGDDHIFNTGDINLLNADWRIKDSSSGRKIFEDTIIGNNPMNVDFQDLSIGTKINHSWKKKNGVFGNNIEFSKLKDPNHIFNGNNPDNASTKEQLLKESVGVKTNTL